MAGPSLADVMRQFAGAYEQRDPKALLPSHQRAIRDIIACRTPALGGHLWHCDHCDRPVYVYHGCRNRACPACHGAQTQQWLQSREAEILPCQYFHLTATIPEPLRKAFLNRQKLLYGLLMSLTARCIQEIAANPRHLGAMPGILGVLHTWASRLDYHPHVHCLVTGGGITPDGHEWVGCRPGFFLPVRMLSRHLRRLFETTLRQKHPELYARVPDGVWRQEWVVHCVPWGNGPKGVLDYLARYVHRIAITDRRIVSMDERNVSFLYKDRKANRQKVCRMEGVELIRRFCLHILPKGFHKVRYYGLWNPKNRELNARVRQMLEMQGRQPTPVQAPVPEDDPPPEQNPRAFVPFAPRCPHCGGGGLRHVRELPRPRIRGP